MNKPSPFLGNFLKVLMLLAILISLFITLPCALVKALIITDLCFALCLFLLLRFKKQSLTFPLYKLINYFCLFNCILAVSTTRIILTIENLEKHFTFAVRVGQWICAENPIMGIFITVTFCFILFFYTKKVVGDSQEIAARFSLDSLNNKMLDIQNQINNGELTETEASIQRDNIREEVDYKYSMAIAAKPLMTTICAISFLFLITIVGGIASGVKIFNMTCIGAITQYSTLSCGYFLFFILALLLTGLGYGNFRCTDKRKG